MFCISRTSWVLAWGLSCGPGLVAEETGPVDALTPVNRVAADDRIRQLEERIRLLERRLVPLEAAQSVVPAVRYVQGPGAPLPVPVVPMPEVPQQVNGVKFKVFLLSTERSKSE